MKTNTFLSGLAGLAALVLAASAMAPMSAKAQGVTPYSALPFAQTIVNPHEASYGTQITVDPELRGSSGFNLESFQFPVAGYIADSFTTDISGWAATYDNGMLNVYARNPVFNAPPGTVFNLGLRSSEFNTADQTATGNSQGGVPYSFVIPNTPTSVPEPSAGLLFFLGALALGAQRTYSGRKD